MEISLAVMMIWCAALLWCSFKETERHLRFVFTVVCLSGGILFFAWHAFTDEFFSLRFWRFRWRRYEEYFRILSSLIIFLTIVYGARVLGTRIDKSGRK
ncbi:MAG: hypothetical protein OXN27_16190 [Candidatus Poribacteria bacterium]|nr:hypothetical protein [Candidatus Poribacteria bacterium]